MTAIDDQRLKELRECAERARAGNHSPYSNFMVLAAVEAANGRLYGGSNVEIINYSLSKHAEEVAILSAISSGQDPAKPWLRTLYVAGGAPCGSCRQFALEFAAPDAVCVLDSIGQDKIRRPGLLLANADPEVWSLRDLLPKAFEPAELRRNQP
jgi:cytidine deaminase